MCLDIGRQKVVEKATENMVVYKRLCPHPKPGKATAPYRDTLYRKGETYKVPAFSSFGWIEDSGKYGHITFTEGRVPYQSIDRGIHAYTSMRMLKSNDTLLWRIAVECIIPKGTPYIKGRNGEIVTLKVRIGRAVAGPELAVKRFNKRKVRR